MVQVHASPSPALPLPRSMSSLLGALVSRELEPVLMQESILTLLLSTLLPAQGEGRRRLSAQPPLAHGRVCLGHSQLHV
jgi:hypothetical protein